MRIPNQTIRTQSMVSYDYASTCIPTLFGELRTAPYDLRYWSILKLLEEERQACGKTTGSSALATTIAHPNVNAVAGGSSFVSATTHQLHQLPNNKVVIRASDHITNANTSADDTCILGYLDDAYLRDEANVFEDWQRSSAIIKQVLGKLAKKYLRIFVCLSLFGFNFLFELEN